VAIWSSPVLAQRAVTDSPRWTRARWGSTRPPLAEKQKNKSVDALAVRAFDSQGRVGRE